MPKKDEIPQFLGNWRLLQNLGSGYSGSIFKAQHIHTHEIVALKVQRRDHECPTNQYERYLYPLLQGGKGMPSLWGSGETEKWSYLAIDLLGSSLDRLYKSNGKETMDLRSVCCIAMQLISRLEHMHNKGVLHRDIQLGNCAIGLPPNEKTLYMIDFGFGKRYIDPLTHCHIPESKEKRDFIGNYWFSSVGVHCRGKVPSRRDDLEALALMLIHLLTPRGLSWTRNGVPKDEDAHGRLKSEKRKARPEELCRGLPPEFEEFLRYCRRLGFYDRPDYTRWVEEFRTLAVESGFSESDDFLWPPPSPRVLKFKPPASKPDEVRGILVDLQNLDLNRRFDIKNNVVANNNDVQRSDRTNKKATVEISSDSDTNESVLLKRSMPKRIRLMRLTKRVAAATDNLALAQLVREFVQDMQCNSSRTLTKEGFNFLDALHKQLADPSIFVLPLRTSRSRSKEGYTEEKEVWNLKQGALARLCREVRIAPSNGKLACLIAEFGRITNNSSGRNVTKDGFGFLGAVSVRLKELHE
ncbi:hypothetical protein AMATHDRAFT_53663 [Amanita thiersii Skay4041]|uniref:Protein kinase domain-containing protein n=1 Tax=Amanita thiersii Skay4041 TaxID=703135 RepID=A0A2A9NV25_9AGAR|nr:hypothetical protein AMATHDRAFT_53663 [Amanita thiersii Skay4041]